MCNVDDTSNQAILLLGWRKGEKKTARNKVEKEAAAMELHWERKHVVLFLSGIFARFVHVDELFIYFSSVVLLLLFMLLVSILCVNSGENWWDH